MWITSTSNQRNQWDAALGILFNKTKEEINKRFISGCRIEKQEEHTYRTSFKYFSGADIDAGIELDFPVKYAQLPTVITVLSSKD